MLNGLPFVVLLPSGNIVLVGSREPVKDFHFAFSSANEKHILSKIVLNRDSFLPILLKDLEEVQILSLGSCEEWTSSLVVRNHAEFRLVLKYFFSERDIFLQASHMQSCVSVDGVF